ncbi:hypothetical protein IFM89_013645 [Coptis chinensis]|uniref:CCHC-type domain-containing protein n=1 Tax=Coptis chinensis TaxID=261450 RepID=A0A835MB79_9MAGN|nr:hypothetical protein IFM89_013645 [Coptis chinensis]
MGDRKNLKIHYAGSFSKRRNGEELSHLDYRSKYPVKKMLDVDSDELNMIDFAADVSLPSHMSKLDYINIKLFYLVSGKQVYVNSDSGLLGMFDLLVVDDEGYCHVFVENDMDESVVPPSQEYDETMCTLMDLKKLIKKRALNANDNGNSMQKKKKSFNDKGFGSKQNKKSDKDKGEAKGKKKSTTHMKGKGVLVDGEDSFRVELSKFFDEEMDLGARTTSIDRLDPDEGYHSINSSDEEIEWQQPRSDEFYNFVYETSNVYVDEGEIVMPTCSDEWKVGMEWPDIETLRHEISDYCIKNRFEVDMRTVNERILKDKSCHLHMSRHWEAQKARTRGADEEVNPNKQIRLCSKCKQPGHNAKTCKGLPAAKKDKHGKKSQEETQASAPVPDEALESTEASQASSPTQASSSKAAKRVCSKCNHPGHNTKTCKGLPTTKKDKHGKKSQEKTQASQASAPTEASKAKSATKSTTEAAPKSSFQASQASSETPQSTAQPATLTFGPPRVRRSKTAQAQVFKAPEQRHTFGDFLSKQPGKSSTSVLEAAELTFTAGGTVRAPIVTKRPRPHGPGSTPFMPAGPASQPWVPPGRVGDAPFKATKKICASSCSRPLANIKEEVSSCQTQVMWVCIGVE